MRIIIFLAMLVLSSTVSAQSYQMPKGEQGYWKLEEVLLWQLIDPAENGEPFAISKLNQLVKDCLANADCKGPLANRSSQPTGKQREAAVAAAHLAELFWDKAEAAGLQRDAVRYVRLHTFANNLLYAPSTYALGRLYLHGFPAGGISQNTEQGVRLLKSAYERGHIESAIELALYYRSMGLRDPARNTFEVAFNLINQSAGTPDSYVEVIHTNLRQLGYPLDEVLASRKPSVAPSESKVVQQQTQAAVRQDRVEQARQCYADAESITRRDSQLRRQLRSLDASLNDVEGDINVLRNTRGTVSGTYSGQLESYARSGQFNQLEQERRELIRERGYVDRELRDLIRYAQSRQSECNLSLYRSEYDLVCKGNTSNSFCKGYDL